MRKNKGFTLIELLVVIAIIGLLSTLAVVSLNNARIKARDARRQSDLKQIATAMELYYSNNNRYPVNSGTLATGACGTAAVVAVTETAGIDRMCATGGITDASQTYLGAIPQDPNTANGAYYFEANTTAGSEGTNYCMYATLEATTGTIFKCTSLGSCAIASSTAACNEAGI